MQESFATAAKVHKQFFKELQQLALASGSLISMLLKEQEKFLRGVEDLLKHIMNRFLRDMRNYRKRRRRPWYS